jgi:hypothetical protein
LLSSSSSLSLSSSLSPLCWVFIHTYIPEADHVPREYSVTGILSLLFMVLISLVPVLALLHFTLALSEVCVQFIIIFFIIIIIIIIIPG